MFRAASTAEQFLVVTYNAVMTNRLGYAALGRIVPAAIFAVILLTKAQTVLRFAGMGVGERVGLEVLTYYGHLLYQSLSLLFLATICLLFMIRQPIVRGLTSMLDAIVALAGTFIGTPLFFAPLAIPLLPILVLADGLMVTGTVLSLLALVHLGRCFGISPQARGLVTSGPYHWIRHPLYVSEEITTLGVLLPVISPITAILFLAHTCLQVRRAISEEAVLSVTFREYDSYRRAVARFIPRAY